MRYRTGLFIDLSILRENYQKIKEIAPSSEVLFMVKADAYGHGALPIVRFAVTELGIKEFGCATLGEAKRLRDELSDLEFELYVFSDIQFASKSCAELFLNRRIIPAISSHSDLDFVLENSEFKHFPICLKFNTGMNRLGFNEEDCERVIEKLKKKGRKNIYHLLSHLSSASSDINKNSITKDQNESFQRIKKSFLDSGISLEKTSLSNSGAIEQKFGLDETHIRPGLMMYGPSSINHEDKDIRIWTGRNISRLDTYVIHTFEAKQGQRIGYGATPCPCDGLVSLIALGYGDGFSTHFQNAILPYKEELGKILGRVNMDMTQIFFKGAKSGFINSGDKFTIWDHDIESILNFSEQTQTIPYELFCQLTNRVPRVYGLN